MTTGLIMKYFVLKPEGSDEYAKASRAAMLAYSVHIQATNPELAREVWAWAERETLAAQETKP